MQINSNLKVDFNPTTGNIAISSSLFLIYHCIVINTLNFKYNFKCELKSD